MVKGMKPREIVGTIVGLTGIGLGITTMVGMVVGTLKAIMILAAGDAMEALAWVGVIYLAGGLLIAACVLLVLLGAAIADV